jgi:transposase
MLDALLAGQTDPAKLADLARGKMRAKIPLLQEALVGVIQPHQRFLLTELLRQLDSLNEVIGNVNTEIAA